MNHSPSSAVTAMTSAPASTMASHHQGLIWDCREPNKAPAAAAAAPVSTTQLTAKPVAAAYRAAAGQPRVTAMAVAGLGGRSVQRTQTAAAPGPGMGSRRSSPPVIDQVAVPG